MRAKLPAAEKGSEGLTKRLLAVLLSGLLVLWASSPELMHGAQARQLQIVVLEGEGALNNIALKRAKEPVVQVLDEEGKPVQGAVVTFTLPSSGPGGNFGPGRLTLTVPTDENGRAVGRGLRPNDVPGPFEIRVVASYLGATARAVIHQINVAPEPERRSRTGTALLILGLVAGAAAGAAVALSGRGGGGAGGGSSPPPGGGTPPPPTTTIRITPGTPRIGGP